MTQAQQLLVASELAEAPETARSVAASLVQGPEEVRVHSFAVVPGRINLIGEHIDYNGFSVLPCALDRGVVLGVGEAADAAPAGKLSLSFRNVQAALYPPLSLTVEIATLANVTVPQHWSMYTVAALKGLNESAPLNELGGKHLVFAVDGSGLPQGAGLSSSSALVVASMLALLSVSGRLASTSRASVASLSALAERHVGTQGGGMDQAAVVFGEAEGALHVSFRPALTYKAVPLPKGLSLVVCDSQVQALKAQAAKAAFNRRVLESRLGTLLLSKLLAIPDWETVLHTHLFDVHQASGKTLAELAELVESSVAETYSRESFAQALGAAVLDEYLAKLPEPLRDALEAEPEGLAIRARLLHVLREADRVFAFVAESTRLAAEGGDAAALGALLDASHDSCRRLYECSCDALDRLQAAARSAGALGARLTGAGWGGAVLALVPDAQVDSFQTALGSTYYADLPAGTTPPVFVAKASQGATVFATGST